MLKRLLLSVVALGVLAACAQTPPPPPSPPDTKADEARLKTDIQKWMDDMNAGNAAGVASQYAEDTLLLPPNAPAVTGRAAVQAFLGKESEGMKAAGLTIKSTATTGIGVSGDWAWMSGTYAVTDAKGASVDVGKYLSVHQKIGGTWLYVRDIWNSDNPAAPPAPTPIKK
jgi:ketosteroid isomerase-like protein